ncbi:MAG: hypothetical protein ACREQ5_13750, partial [Candidatus Dormibacteria bacterium]
HNALEQARQTILVTKHRCATPHERYLDQSNWQAGGLVELIYDDGQGTLQSLGLFREWLYSLSPGGSKLEHSVSTDEPDEFRFVYGEYWVSARQTIKPLSDDSEEITQRFWDLIKEFEE